VTELLDDIDDFQRGRNERPKEAFYCLQPLVVLAREGGSWELVDGQQRLTTILLILTCLDTWLQALKKGKYALSYETRPDSEAFLKAPVEAQHKDNVDFFHLFQAYEAIQAWFDARDGTVQLDFLNCLLAKERNVKVIWYQLQPTDNPIQAFIRLNVGKIPLTNAELIRALFLRERESDVGGVRPSRLQIAHEWDGIEKRLQDDAFWYFIHQGASPYPARIEYLFTIRVLQLGPAIPVDDAYGTFIAYQHHFQAGGSAEASWREIRQLALRLEEWSADRTLYHLVGFWIATASASSGEVVKQLLAQREVSSRTSFERHLRGLIFRNLIGKDLSTLSPVDVAAVVQKYVGDLSYKPHRPQIRAVLLLFNVASLLRNTGSTLRFPFDLFKMEVWDIEHIRSVKSEMPGRPDLMKAWLERVLEYWAGRVEAGSSDREELRLAAVRLTAVEPLDTAAFQALYERILAYFHESESTEADNRIANLTLLDAGTNRGYKNAVFPVKRAQILALDKAGTFVPLCTTNVFLKYYSTEIEQMMFWRRDDGERYEAAIIECLTHFFSVGAP
jgi:hypothetical protein